MRYMVVVVNVQGQAIFSVVILILPFGQDKAPATF